MQIKNKLIMREAKDALKAILIGDAMEESGIEVFAVNKSIVRSDTYEVWGKVKNIKCISVLDKRINELIP